MNKLGLCSLILAAASLTMVGCAANQSHETAQANQTTTQTEPSLAQSATAGVEAQGGVAVQADPSIEGAEPIQVSPAIEAPQAEQPIQ